MEAWLKALYALKAPETRLWGDKWMLGGPESLTGGLAEGPRSLTGGPRGQYGALEARMVDPKA